MRTYSIFISFKDASGKNILENITNDHSGEVNHLGGDRNGWTEIIDSELYKYEAILPEPCFKITTSPVITTPPVGPPKVHPLYVTKYEDYYLLEIGHTSSNTCLPIHTIKHILTCSHIFGDNAEHTLVSYWHPRIGLVNCLPFKFESVIFNNCYRITVDGKEFSVTQEPFRFYSWDTVSVAWVVLDN